MKTTTQFIILLVVAIAVSAYVIHVIYGNSVEDLGHITTEVGDSFHIYYDPKAKMHQGFSYIRQDNTDFELRISGKIGKENFKLIKNDESFRGYMICDYAFIYNDGSSDEFKLFFYFLGDECTADQMVFPYLLSTNETLGSYYETNGFKEKYPERTAEIVKAAKNKDYFFLEQYGLPEADGPRNAIIDRIIKTDEK